MKNTILGFALAASLLLAGLSAPSAAAAYPAGPPTKRARRSLASTTSTTKRLPQLHRKIPKTRRSLAARLRHRRPSGWGWLGDSSVGDDGAGDDPVVRQVALDALGKLNGSVVVLDPNTGRILSIVNQKVALQEAFTPCSTFKPVVAAGALKEGIITPETRLRAEGRFAYYYGTSRINMTQALAESSNEFFAKLGQMLGFDRVTKYAEAFGLGERTGLDIPDESPGVFPPEPPRQGGVGLLTSFGQNIEMTPLQLAAIVASIANGGTLFYLQYPRTPEEVASFEPRVRRHLDSLAPYLPEVKQGMEASVLYGTGKLAFSPDEQIFGKTGTCSENGTHLRWFASFSSDQKPNRVVVVLLRGQGSTYGPHAPEIAGKIYRDLLEKSRLGAQAHSLFPGASSVGR